MTRTFGIEVEYATNALMLASRLAKMDLSAGGGLHSYHCDCENCDFESDFPWRAQRDSTVNGEFITAILSDLDEWDEMADTFARLAREAGCTTTASTGMHVHVGIHPDRYPRWDYVVAAYYAYERFFAEIVAPGASRAKREMNVTLNQAWRNLVADDEVDVRGGECNVIAAGNLLRDAIARDRHVDLNLSGHVPTYEFRVYNSTLAAWRMSMAARLAVAFVDKAEVLIEATGIDEWGWGEFLAVGAESAYATKAPPVGMADFVGIVTADDPVLAAHIDRQTAYMRNRYRKVLA